jgi:glycosyltransferase involved in cell wall biosynthesis
MKESMIPPRFAVIQVGARLHYAAPAILEQAGMLQALYTDAHSGSPATYPLRAIPQRFMPGGLRRLLSRHVPSSIPAAKVRSWIYPSYQIERLNRFHPKARKRARFWHQHGIGGHWLANRAILEDFGGADALYVHPCASTDAVREARRRGMFVVVEAVSHPLNKLVEAEEYRKFGLPSPEPDDEVLDNLEFFKEEAILADLVLAASPYVRDGLIDVGIDAKRISTVPYGIDSKFFNDTPTPQPGRVLYVGNVGYLKGVPYLAEAARRLDADAFECEIRAVGPHDPELIRRSEFVGPEYVGQVPRTEVKEEFLNADVFVFPSLSDGFGIVLLEAMAAGLPVICTPNCGAVVRDGIEGFLVPVHDAEAIAERIKLLVANRDLRQRMGEAARVTARKYSLEAYNRDFTKSVMMKLSGDTTIAI